MSNLKKINVMKLRLRFEDWAGNSYIKVIDVEELSMMSILKDEIVIKVDKEKKKAQNENYMPLVLKGIKDII